MIKCLFFNPIYEPKETGLKTFKAPSHPQYPWVRFGNRVSISPLLLNW